MKKHLTPEERVAAWFKLRGWSLRKAAEASSIHYQRLHRVTAGKSEVKAAEVELIAQALGISVVEFYGGQEEGAA